MQAKEGYIDFKGYKTYYVSYGDLKNGKTPLVVLHGGPGYPHDYLENLSKLAEGGQPVLFYDQLGCGKSDRPDDPKLWTIDLFVEELGVIRKTLGLESVHLLGHSWGGTLTLEYMFTKPQGVEKMILSSSVLDSQMWVDEAKRLIAELPEWAAEIMQKSEAGETVDAYESDQAYAEYTKRHICRVEPYPKAMVMSDKGSGGQVYRTMWGPNETRVTGILSDWTSLDRIHEIDVPTLFISGEYDECTPKQVEAAKNLLPGSKWVLLEESSHVGNLEQPEKYFAAVSEFLSSAII